MKFKSRRVVLVSVLILSGSFGLLTLTDMLNVKEPTIAENLTLNAVEWQFERPSFIFGGDDSPFWDRVFANYTSDISINQTVIIDDYKATDSEFGGSPSLDFVLDLTASLLRGYVETVNITFYDEHANSLVNLWEPGICVLQNLTLVRYSHYNVGRVEKGFIDYKGVNKPIGVHLSNPVKWALRTPHNETQELMMRVEVTYFNGTAYKKVVQPFKIKLIADMSTSFENAEIVNSGQLIRRLLGGDDREDYYKIFVENGEVIKINMTPPMQVDFDLYLYSPNSKNFPVKSSTNGGDTMESIEYVADVTGWWFIQVKHSAGWGIYSLNVTLVHEG
jgi:hypothetical protein